MRSDVGLRRLPGAPRALLFAPAGRAARHTRALAGAADWRRGAVDTAAFARVDITGTAGLPTASRWTWPDIEPDELAAALRSTFPNLQLLGAVLPRQAGRSRLSLLCRSAGNALVVKLGSDEHSLRTEHDALEQLTIRPLPGIATPRPFGIDVLGTDSSGPVVFLATSALGLDAQRPAIDAPLRTFESDLGERLGSLPTGEDGHEDLVPVHGDLTPWNLRRTRRGLALFDWEAVGWGRPGSDLAHYRQASDSIRPWWRRAPGVTA